MKSLLDALPDSVTPEATLDAEAAGTPIDGPDDDDVIRPFVEDELLTATHRGSALHRASTSLSKHLLWTFGPAHRDFPFHLQLRAEVEGDRLVVVDPEIGWLHQGIEKALEETPLEQGFEWMERLHPENSLGHELAWAHAVERLLGVDRELPERVRLWRTVGAELSRILEHLRVLSALVRAHLERRAQAAFVEAASELEPLLLELAYPGDVPVFRCVGGLCAQIPQEMGERIATRLPEMLSRVQSMGERLWQNPAFLDSLAGLGKLEARRAVALGLSGPALRACGVADDLRTQDPYFAYDLVAPRVPTQDAGDTLARFAVRLDEIAESRALVLRALAALRGVAPGIKTLADIERDDEGRIRAPRRVESASVELPSGELSVVLAGAADGTLARARIRGASFPLAFALSELLADARLDGVVTIIRSLGISGTELDR